MTSWTSESIAGIRFPGLSDDEQATVRQLLRVWQARLAKNQKRSLYFDGEQAFKDLNIALPPQLKNAKFFLGWAAQAVKKPAARSQFQGLKLPGVDDPFELSELLGQNRFGLEFAQATVAAGKHGVSFVTVASGAPGEPVVQIQAHAAESAAAIWDQRRRWVSAGLTVGSVDGDGNPDELTVYLPDQVLVCERSAGVWSVDRWANGIGRPLMVPVTHAPALGRPFGQSRITRPVMALTDMAVRAYVRMEGNAEFYSAPQIAVLGADDAAFEGMGKDRKFQLAMDRLIGLTKDADGDKPELKQLKQASMQPHSDMLRTVAMAFAGETGIPPSSLGVLHDQPSSAEAIHAAEHDLLVDVTYQNDYVLNYAASDIARLAVMVRDGLSEPPADAWKLSAAFADPEFRSTSANAAAYVQIAGANPALAESDVLLETVFSPDQVARVRGERAKASAPSLLESVLSGGQQGQSESNADLDQAKALSAKFEALGVAVRAGVDSNSAAELLGLTGLKFTGAPVSLRLPTEDASKLESADGVQG